MTLLYHTNTVTVKFALTESLPSVGRENGPGNSVIFIITVVADAQVCIAKLATHTVIAIVHCRDPNAPFRRLSGTTETMICGCLPPGISVGSDGIDNLLRLSRCLSDNRITVEYGLYLLCQVIATDHKQHGIGVRLVHPTFRGQVVPDFICPLPAEAALVCSEGAATMIAC